MNLPEQLRAIGLVWVLLTAGLESAAFAADPSPEGLSKSEIQKLLDTHLKDVQGDVETSVYSRRIPDQRRQFSSGKAVVALDAVPPWHKAAPSTEKPPRLVDGLRALSSGVKFRGTGIAWHGEDYYVTSLNFPLNRILLGGEANVRAANEWIVSRGSDPTAAVGPFTFGDDEFYYLYFRHRDALTPDSLKVLSDVIVRAGTEPKYSGHGVGKAYGKNIFQNHNQTIHGWHLGILAAKITGDPKLMTDMEECLDRMIAHAALQGFSCTEYNSPSYSGFNWNMLLTVYSLIDNPRIEAKLRLLLDLVGLDVADRFHGPTASFMGPHSRMSRTALWKGQSHFSTQLILYRCSNEYVFWPHDLTQGYGYTWGLMASLTPHFPDYLQQIAFQKPFPYRVWNAHLSNEASTNSAGVEWKLQDVVAYATEEYTLGSKSDQVWRWNTGLGGQDGNPTAFWRRSIRPVQSYSDSGSLNHEYRYNGKQPEKALGLSACVQHDNKAVVLSYPGRVTDAALAEHAKVDGAAITSMATTLLLRWPAEITGVWIEDEFVMAGRTLVSDGDREIRARAVSSASRPYAIASGKTVFIEDFNTYIALRPLETTDLGRERDGDLHVEFVDGTPLLTISFYNYLGNPKAIDPLNREQQRNGFILEFGEKKEFATLAEFRRHIRAATVKQDQSGDIWAVQYASGPDTLEIRYDTTRFRTIARVVNGIEQNEKYLQVPKNISEPAAPKGLYDWMDIEPWKSEMPEVMRSNCAVKSRARLITLGTVTLANPGQAMVYLVAAPGVNPVYAVGNLTQKTCDFTLTTPQGVVDIQSLNLGRVVFRPAGQDSLEVDAVPGMSPMAPAVTVRATP